MGRSNFLFLKSDGNSKEKGKNEERASHLCNLNEVVSLLQEFSIAESQRT